MFAASDRNKFCTGRVALLQLNQTTNTPQWLWLILTDLSHVLTLNWSNQTRFSRRIGNNMSHPGKICLSCTCYLMFSGHPSLSKVIWFPAVTLMLEQPVSFLCRSHHLSALKLSQAFQTCFRTTEQSLFLRCQSIPFQSAQSLCFRWANSDVQF